MSSNSIGIVITTLSPRQPLLAGRARAVLLQDAQQCLELLRAAAARAGLLSPCRHAHWPKACQRLGDALAGLGQHRQVRAWLAA